MSEKQLEKLYYSIYPMNQCETQSKSYEETKELCETLEKEMISLMSPDLQAMFEDYKEYTLNLKQTERRLHRWISVWDSHNFGSLFT